LILGTPLPRTIVKHQEKIIKLTLDENSLDGSNSQIQVRDVNYTKRKLYNARRKIMPKYLKVLMTFIIF